MKKGFVAIAAAVALAATSLIGPAVAGIGPARGLPVVSQAQLVTNGGDTYTIADTAIEGARGSVMCVACHTRNPSVRTAYGNANGKTVTGYAGSHYVTQNFADTAEGGGYSDSNKGRRTATPLYMAGSIAARANGGQWAGAPKYGTLAGANDVGPNSTDPSAVAAQMICESCHNIVTNIGAAKLLEAAFANGGDNGSYTIPPTTAIQGIAGATGGTLAAKLCVGCHGRMSASVSAEWQLHPIGAATWSGTHHHRNTGTAPYYGNGGTAVEAAPDNMALIGREYYPDPALVQMWGANYGELAAGAPRALTYASGTNKKMKAPISTGQIAVNGGAASTQVLCTNCHRAHNAATTSGATILMTYTPAVAFGPTVVADAATGMGTKSRAGQITQTNPLCLNCHQ